MKPKYLLTVAAIVGAARMGYAQYSQDALRYSTYQTGGTARIKAVGNAGTAIGGDLSSIGGNPAGIGFFTRSEASLTPEFDMSKVNSTYQGQAGRGTSNALNLSNIAAVFYSRLNNNNSDKSKGWLSFNFGVSYNRTNNYYENVNYGGINKNNSITNYYAQDAQNNNYLDNNGVRQIYDNTLGSWAFNQNLIDNYGSTASPNFKSSATSPAPYTGANLNPSGYNQSSAAIRTGGESELSMSVGANYSNKLYLGLGIGVTSLRYNTNTNFYENGVTSVYTAPGPPLVYTNQSYVNNYSQDQETKGTGVNLKLGFIFKPVDAVRLGASLTTPTWYNIDDNYSETMSTKLSTSTSATTITNPSANYPFSYKLQTPLKVAGGMAIFIKQFGFITGDVEYLDYSSARLSGDYSYNNDNNDIRKLYQSAVNAHVGAEARLSSEFFLRGGYGTQGNPLKLNGSPINTTSGGIGYRNSDYYIDITYSHLESSSVIYPYEVGSASPAAALSKTNDNVFVTVGFRF